MERVVIVCVSISLFLFLSAISFLFGSYYYQNKVRKLEKVKRRKKKKHQEHIMFSKKKSKRYLTCGSLCLVIAITLAATSGYIMYQQKVHLSNEDKEAVTRGYYLLSDFEDQLNQLDDKKLDKEKTVQTIQSLGSLMASYSEEKASPLNQVKGQQKLNRYYQSIKEIGINATTQSQELVVNQEMLKNYLKDVKKAKNYEKDIFSFYKVNEMDLKNK